MSITVYIKYIGVKPARRDVCLRSAPSPCPSVPAARTRSPAQARSLCPGSGQVPLRAPLSRRAAAIALPSPLPPPGAAGPAGLRAERSGAMSAARPSAAAEAEAVRGE